MLLSATSQLLTQLGSPRRWLKDDGYLPFTLSRSSSTGSLAFKEESYTPSSHSASFSPGRAPSSSATNTTIHWTSTTTLRRILFILFHTVLLAFGCFGIYMLIGLHTGMFLQVPVYSKYDIAQSGYFRPLITTPPSIQAWRNSPSTSHLSGTVSDHHNGAAIDSEQAEQAPQHFRTPVDSWTFPSSSTPGSHQSPTPPKSSDQHLLILSPIRNAQDALPTYFHHLENLKHPKSNTSIGFLLSDEEDETGRLVKQWVDEQASKGEYRHITLLRKDFGLLSPNGQARHKDWIQAQRRGLMGRARTLLLTSVINPTVDWVFWLDVDVRHLPSTIIQDLMLLGQIETNSSDPQGRVSNETETVIADIIVPNIMDKWKGNLRGYDLSECIIIFSFSAHFRITHDVLTFYASHALIRQLGGNTRITRDESNP